MTSLGFGFDSYFGFDAPESFAPLPEPDPTIFVMLFEFG
jgi:hypothetical protein